MKKIYKELKRKGVINDKVKLGDVWNKQIGGLHYQNFVIQPSKFVVENKLLFPEGCAIKYICRHPFKGKKEEFAKSNSLYRDDN